MELIKDKFRKTRGGYARLLDLSCEKCNNHLLIYQKDGPGPLKRLYVDRILKPKQLWKKEKKLVCSKCKTWLGIGAVYTKESRKCFVLFEAVIHKKLKKHG